MTIEYASRRRLPPISPRAVAGPLTALILVGCVAAFAWLRLAVDFEYDWLATTPHPPGASAWRQATDEAGRAITVRDTSSQTIFFTVHLQQVYDPDSGEGTRRPPRNSHFEYRPVFWIAFAAATLALAGNVMVLIGAREKKAAQATKLQ